MNTQPDMPTIPDEAFTLLRRDYVRCFDRDFADFVTQHSRGGLVAVQAGRHILLVPTATWERIRDDVAGIVAELAHAARR